MQLTFTSHLTKSTAEKFKDQILQAFESVLGSPLTIEIRCELKKDTGAGSSVDPEFNTGYKLSRPGTLELGKRGPRDGDTNAVSSEVQILHSEPQDIGRSEIVEVPATPKETKDKNYTQNKAGYHRRSIDGSWSGEASTSQRKPAMASNSDRRRLSEPSQSRSLVRGKVSLAHVIQQAEGCTQRNGWSKRKAVSIAEKLEQENLYVFPYFQFTI